MPMSSTGSGYAVTGTMTGTGTNGSPGVKRRQAGRTADSSTKKQIANIESYFAGHGLYSFQ